MIVLTLLTAATLAAPGDAPPAGYRVPPGWKMAVAAAEPLVVNPVTMTFGDDGRLYVVEWKAGRGPNDRIKVLTDADGDGTFDRSDVFMDGLDLPAGVLFRDGWVYVTLDHDVVRFRDRDGDGRFEARESIATGFGNDDSHHRVSGLAMGPDGWIYMTTGDSDAHARGSDGSTADVLRSGGVFRCRPDGSGLENVAFGMRNPWGNVAFDDAFRIVHTDNDNEGSPGFTGCRLLHVVESGDYGWRLREGARCCNPDFERATWNGGRPGRLGWMAETGRGAPAGLGVLNSPAFPKSVQNLLVYPDVFRKSVRGYRLKPDGATFRAVDEFELLGSDDGLFRPTDAEVGPDGALYVLDWRTDSGGAGQLSGNGTTGRIYRMTWAGTPAEPARPTLPRDRFLALQGMNTSSLLDSLAADDYGLRRAAALELIRRGPSAEVSAGLRRRLGAKDGPASARLHALGVLWALEEQNGVARLGPTLAKSVGDPSPDVRRYALDLLGRLRLPEDGGSRTLTAVALYALRDDERPEARRAAALAAGRLGRLDAGAEVADGGAAVEAVRKAVAEALRRPDERLEVAPDAINTLSAGLIAGELLRASSADAGADAFLRDGYTRGLERLGPPGLAAVTTALGAPGSKLAGAALFALQGWRSDDALAAILDGATAAGAEVPEDARVGLFRALREMAPKVPAEPVVRWLSAEPKAGPRAREQAVRLLSSLRERAVLAAGPIVPGLLTDPDPGVRRAAFALAADVRSDKARAALEATVRAADRPVDERALALGALRSYEGVDFAPLAAEVFRDAKDPGLRRELLRAVAARDFDRAARMSEALLGDDDQGLRQEAIGVLGSKPRTALIVARRYLDGGLPPQDLSRVIEAVRSHATPELQTVLQTLLKKTLLAAPTGEEARRLREYVARRGNPDRGRAVFFEGAKGACATCHRIEGRGGNVGPDLTRVWETLSFEKRVESILEPSKEIKEGFGTFKVATTDGRVLTGLLVSDTPEAVTLKDAEGREVRVPAGEVEEKGADQSSLMPAGVVGHLALDDLADLLAFLGDRAAQERLRAEPAK